MSVPFRVCRAAAIQAAPVFLDREATVEKACRLIGEAVALGRALREVLVRYRDET